MIKFFCPKCQKYVRFIGELIPLDEELALHCEECGEETVILSIRPTMREADGVVRGE